MGVTRIITNFPPLPDLVGRALAVSTPQDGFDNHWNVGAIVAVDSPEPAIGYIDVLDPAELISSALAENECGFVVYDNHDTAIGASAHHTFGAWTDAPAHASGFTTFFDATAGSAIKDFMVGWLLVPDVQQLAYLEIVAVADGEISIKGNAENMAADGTNYWLIAPAGVSATTGAIETNPCRTPNPWLWAGYHYRPPVAGFHNPQGQDPGVYGKQPGQNQAGTYDCWNRVYEPQTGRWTTPDPAMTPWTNVLSYTVADPLQFADPTGLEIDVPSLKFEDIGPFDLKEAGVAPPDEEGRLSKIGYHHRHTVVFVPDKPEPKWKLVGDKALSDSEEFWCKVQAYASHTRFYERTLKGEFRIKLETVRTSYAKAGGLVLQVGNESVVSMRILAKPTRRGSIKQTWKGTWTTDILTDWCVSDFATHAETLRKKAETDAEQKANDNPNSPDELAETVAASLE